MHGATQSQTSSLQNSAPNQCLFLCTQLRHLIIRNKLHRDRGTVLPVPQTLVQNKCTNHGYLPPGQLLWHAFWHQGFVQLDLQHNVRTRFHILLQRQFSSFTISQKSLKILSNKRKSLKCLCEKCSYITSVNLIVKILLHGKITGKKYSNRSYLLEEKVSNHAPGNCCFS